MRLGLLGGTFDPVHYGHLLLAESAREQCRLDAVWFVPTGRPPHKPADALTPAQVRIEMLELALAAEPAFAVCGYEVEREGISYTVDTLERIAAEDTARELFFLMGADMLADLPNWREPRRICELALPVAATRGDCGPPDFDVLAPLVAPQRLAEIRAHHVEMPAVGFSSRAIRRRVAAGRSIRYWTPRAVEEFIHARGLYRRSER